MSIICALAPARVVWTGIGQARNRTTAVEVHQKCQRRIPSYACHVRVGAAGCAASPRPRECGRVRPPARVRVSAAGCARQPASRVGAAGCALARVRVSAAGCAASPRPRECGRVRPPARVRVGAAGVRAGPRSRGYGRGAPLARVRGVARGHAGERCAMACRVRPAAGLPAFTAAGLPAVTGAGLPCPDSRHGGPSPASPAPSWSPFAPGVAGNTARLAQVLWGEQPPAGERFTHVTYCTRGVARPTGYHAKVKG